MGCVSIPVQATGSKQATGNHAPYQPRFEWNLWFASLGNWREYRFVLWTEERLLSERARTCWNCLRAICFPGAPPKEVRSVMYQYWFTSEQTRRERGLWWRREMLGEYAPTLEREPDGKIVIMDFPGAEAPTPGPRET